MEVELTLIHSSTDVSNIFNSTTDSTVDEGTFKWTSDEIARLIQIVVRPIFLTVGTTGNGLTFYIMRRTSLKMYQVVSTCLFWLWQIRVSVPFFPQNKLKLL